jgi:hypothetical protein
MDLEELSVGVAEMQMPSSESLEFPMRDEHGNRPSSASQFDFDARFSLVDDPRELGSGFGDRISVRHL